MRWNSFGNSVSSSSGLPFFRCFYLATFEIGPTWAWSLSLQSLAFGTTCNVGLRVPQFPAKACRQRFSCLPVFLFFRVPTQLSWFKLTAPLRILRPPLHRLRQSVELSLLVTALVVSLDFPSLQCSPERTQETSGYVNAEAYARGYFHCRFHFPSLRFGAFGNLHIRPNEISQYGQASVKYDRRWNTRLIGPLMPKANTSNNHSVDIDRSAYQGRISRENDQWIRRSYRWNLLSLPRLKVCHALKPADYFLQILLEFIFGSVDGRVK